MINNLKENKFFLPIVIIIAALVAYVVFFGFPNLNNKPSEYDEFAACLTQRGLIMYGTDWCRYCKTQKDIFGSSFRFINYINCDPDNDRKPSETCTKINIKAYPTWYVNGEFLEGVQPLDVLANKSNCKLPFTEQK